MFLTGYSSPRGLISWVLGLGANARLLGPEQLTAELERRLELLEELHGDSPPQPPRAARVRAGAGSARGAHHRLALARGSQGRGGRRGAARAAPGARTPRSAPSASRAW